MTLLGCWATGLPLPSAIVDAHAADLDGDDEFVVLRANGALRNFDAE